MDSDVIKALADWADCCVIKFKEKSDSIAC